MKKEALILITRSAMGSLRDAENLLEQVFTFFGSNISLTQVQSMLGITGDKRVKEFAKHIINNDILSGIKTINAVTDNGINLKQFNVELVEYLRYILLIKNGCDDCLDITTEEITELKDLASSTSLDHILTAVKLFSNLDFGFRDDSSLPFELALIDCNLASIIKNQPHSKELVSEPINQIKEIATSQVACSEEKQPKIITEAIEESSLPMASGVSNPEDETKLDFLKSNWRKILEQAPENTKRTAAIAILRSAGVQPIAIDGDTIVLNFKYLYHKEKIEEMENSKTVANIISNFMGHSFQLRCVHETEENHLVKEAQRIGAKITEVEEK
jgi:DNA polymerase-3 subunit gamma/tau